MEKTMGFTTINMTKIAEQVKSTLGSEEEPFEGEVPIKEVEKVISAKISSSSKEKYVFDGYTHKSNDDFVRFIS
jgi:hypothetical protein